MLPFLYNFRKYRLICSKETVNNKSMTAWKWEGSSEKLRGERKFGWMNDKFLVYIVLMVSEIFASTSVSTYYYSICAFCFDNLPQG